MKIPSLILPAAFACSCLVAGCYTQPSPNTDTETDATDTQVATDGSGPALDSTTGGGCPGAAGAIGPDCPADAPYCLDNECVGCGSLPAGTCEEIDAGTPVCDAEAGVCGQCSSADASQCSGGTPVCVDNACAPCTADDQCDSGLCVLMTGECQPSAISLEGRVLAAEFVEPTAAGAVDLLIANVNPPLSFDDTPASGDYELPDIPPGSTVDVSLDVEEGWAGDDNSTFRTVHQIPIGLATPQTDDLEVVRYEWLAQVALDCGLYPFAATATPWDVLCSPDGGGGTTPGCESSGVGSFILTRSTVVGTLYQEDGVTPFTDPISRFSLDTVMTNNNIPVGNVVNNPGDADAFPFQVCWLDDAGGTYVGTTEDNNVSGRFVLFRLRNSLGLGQGTVDIEATGFTPGHVRLTSSGSIGVVSMVRTNEKIVRDFGNDIYPMFQEWDCVLCHSTGGVGAIEGERDGYFADWSLSIDEVYDNLVGPGTECDLTVPLDDPNFGTDEYNSSGRTRVCLNAPEQSLLIMRPSATLPPVNEVHPVDIFPGPEHPQMVVVREWIEQGAMPASNEPVDFTTEVYPIFTTRGCIACHTACSTGAPGAGCKLDDATNTYQSDWNLPAVDVYTNLTGPGTTCADPEGAPLRVCVNAPESSLFVVRPLAGVPPNDPHPTEIFPSLDDPDLQTIIRWIEQGATL